MIALGKNIKDCFFSNLKRQSLHIVHDGIAALSNRLFNCLKDTFDKIEELLRVDIIVKLELLVVLLHLLIDLAR